MFLQGQFQNAYVTRDLDRGMALVRSQFGMDRFALFEPDLMVLTPNGEQKVKLRAAVGWIGQLQFELIEPVSGLIDHYTGHLPQDEDDATPRFHHIGLRRDDLDDMRAEIARLGLPVIFEGQAAGVVFIYVDARASLGHFLEYIWATPDGWAMQGWPKSRGA